MKSPVVYLITAFVVAFAVLLIVPLWSVLGAIGGGHGGHAIAEVMSRDLFSQYLDRQQKRYGLEDGSVRIMDGGDIYILAQQFTFLPRVIRVETGKMYHLNFYSPDVFHGATLVRTNGLGTLRAASLNNVLPPGPVTTIMMTFHLPGEVLITCTEYCGLGHHMMQSKIIAEGEPYPMEAMPWYQRVRMPQLPVSMWIYHDILNRQVAAPRPELSFDPLPQMVGFFMAPHQGWDYWHYHGVETAEKEHCQKADLADGVKDGRIAPGTAGIPRDFVDHFNRPPEKTRLCLQR